MNFEELFNRSPEWMRTRYRLMSLELPELSEEEKRFILWLASWDMDAVLSFLGIIRKVQGS